MEFRPLPSEGFASAPAVRRRGSLNRGKKQPD
jgi:hypothetical protein